MTRRVTSPVPGVYYEIDVHGEPPEGVEVLWSDMPEELTSWTETRYKHVDTHWMRAPVDAPVPEAKEPRGDDPFSWVCRDWCNPVPEEPPFPLSREEFEAWFSGRKFIEGGPFWLWFRNASTPTYEDAVTAWRAAGCPGATPAAEEGAAQEGPWKTIKHHCGWEVYRGGSTTEFESAAFFYNDRPRGKKRARRLARLLNRAHELEREVERLATKLDDSQEELRQVLDTCGQPDAPLDHASLIAQNHVRSLRERAEKAEAEREAAKTTLTGHWIGEFVRHSDGERFDVVARRPGVASPSEGRG